MKKILLLLLVLLLNHSYAVHVVGGEINYTYIGTATNPNRYQIDLHLLLDATGPPFPQSAVINISSSCYASSNATLPLLKLISQGSAIYECTDTSFVSYYEIGHYSAQVDLSGTCSDWTFVYETCCRMGNLANISNPSGTMVYLESILDNTQWENNSASFIDPLSRAFCISSGKTQFWQQRAVDADGDSIFYRIIPSRTGGGANIPFSPGYSTFNPISNANGFNFNNQDGNISLKPNNIEVDVVSIAVDEYSLTSSGWIYKGTVARDVLIDVVSACDTTSQDWHLSTEDSAEVFTKSMSCGDSSIRVYTNFQLIPGSVATDAHEFRMIHDSIGFPLTSAEIVNENTIELNLHKPFLENGDYYLYMKKGVDGNTILNNCGWELTGMDTLIFKVSGCSGIGLQEIASSLEIYPNPVDKEVYFKIKQSFNLFHISVTDLHGRILFEEKNIGSDLSKINVEFLPSGIYILNLQSEKENYYRLFNKN